MEIESLQIKNKYYYLCDDTIYICDFDIGLGKYLNENQKLVLIFIILDTSQIVMIL